MTTPTSNSDIAALLTFIHRSGDNFIRLIRIEDNESPRNPIDLTGHDASFQITTCKKPAEIALLINTDDNPTNISITGTDHNIISINVPITLETGKYNYKLSIKDPSGNIRTWLRGDFNINC